MSQENKKPFLKWHDYVAIGIIAAVTIWIFRTYHNLNVENQNEQGDALGGLTAPFIGLVSAILVYLSFRAQIYANERIQDQLDATHQQTNFEFLQQEIARTISEFDKFNSSEINPQQYGILALRHAIISLESFDPKSSSPYSMKIKRKSQQLYDCFAEVINLSRTIADVDTTVKYKKICGRKLWHFYATYIREDIEEFRKSSITAGSFELFFEICDISAAAEAYLKPFEKDYEAYASKMSRLDYQKNLFNDEE